MTTFQTILVVYLLVNITLIFIVPVFRQKYKSLRPTKSAEVVGTIIVFLIDILFCPFILMSYYLKKKNQVPQKELEDVIKQYKQVVNEHKSDIVSSDTASPEYDKKFHSLIESSFFFYPKKSTNVNEIEFFVAPNEKFANENSQRGQIAIYVFEWLQLTNRKNPNLYNQILSLFVEEEKMSIQEHLDYIQSIIKNDSLAQIIRDTKILKATSERLRAYNKIIDRFSNSLMRLFVEHENEMEQFIEKINNNFLPTERITKTNNLKVKDIEDVFLRDVLSGKNLLEDEIETEREKKKTDTKSIETNDNRKYFEFSEKEKADFLSFVCGKTLKKSVLFLKFLFENKKKLGINFLDKCNPNKTFFSVMELSAIAYIYYDIALLSNKLKSERAVFNNAFYDSCKNLADALNEEFTPDYFNSLTDEIGELIRNNDENMLNILSARISQTLKNNAPVDNILGVGADFFDVVSLVPYLTKYTIESMEGAKHFTDTLKGTSK